MKFEPLISLNQETMFKLTQEQKLEFIKCCPRQVFAYNNETNMIDKVREKDCVFCFECDTFQKK